MKEKRKKEIARHTAKVGVPCFDFSWLVLFKKGFCVANEGFCFFGGLHVYVVLEGCRARIGVRFEKVCDAGEVGDAAVKGDLGYIALSREGAACAL